MGQSAEGGRSAPSVALLDTCALFPAALRDTLLRAVERGLYAGRWTEAILEEMVRNVVEHGRETQACAEALRAAIRSALPDALVAGYEHRIDGLTNHPKDRHVLAAGIHASANVIVTSNLGHFPKRALAPYGIEAWSPDDFLCALLDAFSEHMAAIIVEQAAALKRRAKTPEDVLAVVGLVAPAFAGRMRRSIRHLGQ